MSTALNIFSDPIELAKDLESFASASENLKTSSSAQQGSSKTLTHDKLYQATKGFINSAVQSKKSYIIIPFSQFSPHTNDDIDLLLGVTNEERTQFTATNGRWDEMFKATFATKGYEYEWCYYRNEHLPFGVMVSWDEGVGSYEGTGDTEYDDNLKMAKEKYGQFLYPKYYYFLPTKAETAGAYANTSSNLQLTDVLEATFNLVNTLINGAIATNKKYIQVLWSDINKANPDYVKSQFYTDDNTIRIHSWTVDDKISTYSNRTSNNPIVTIDKTVNNFSIKDMLSSTGNGHAYTYTPILDPSKIPLGFILSWHDASDTITQESINAIITGYGTTPEGTEEILVLPVFNYADQALHKTEIRKNMRTSYIKAFADKIQSKLTAAFNKSENSIAILWTEVASGNANSVKNEWVTNDYFSKKLESKPYDDDSSVKSLDVDTKKNIYEALATLDICKQIGSDTGNTEQKVYWDYLHYKDIADQVAATANESDESKKVKFTQSNSCGVTFVFAAHNVAQSEINTVQQTYRGMNDPMKKSNNS